MRQTAVLPEARQPGVHQPRVASQEHVRAQSQPLHDAGTKRFQKHVRISASLQGDLLAEAVAEVYGDGALASNNRATQVRKVRVVTKTSVSE